MDEEPANLEQLLDRIDVGARGLDKVSLGVIVAAAGSRSFGPLLLIVGVILASPLSGIPGMPTTMGLLVLLISVQLFFRGDNIWLPGWLLRRSMAQAKLRKALDWMRPPARFIDRWLRPRWAVFIGRLSVYLMAMICLVIAVSMPVMELVPFSATSAGVVLTAFGLSLIAQDGSLALFAFGLTAITIGWVIHKVLSA